MLDPSKPDPDPDILTFKSGYPYPLDRLIQFFLCFDLFLQEHHVKTCDGLVSVVVYGDQEKPALITYPDVALNYLSCFQGLFLCPEAVSLLLHNFCHGVEEVL
ncbi:hypothetical protein F2Q69_00009391 [Brassica cretica]|uniref:Uncharacterized protein n=1 Tax=Brassica cretica TaxID=69181 RepID=A0A8S9PGK5_BRACR|nr:hypothetical protein F2Q69_00009391 [Brassica cretica]